VRRVSVVALVAGVILTGVLLATPAAAQDPSLGQVDISFDVGSYDPEIGDWAVEVVIVTGALAEGEAFTVELRDVDGSVVWSATQAYSPGMRIVVDRPVPVGVVAEAGVSQAQTIVAGEQVVRPEVTWSAAGGGGAGQLSLSMVLAVVVVAIVFRTPMPSASTQRWTR
jgi:hypothetical protein